MSAFQQVIIGTGLLGFSAIFHVSVMIMSIPLFSKIAERIPQDTWPKSRMVGILLFAIVVLVLAHTVQVWTWAVVFLILSDLQGLPTSFYFATVTYTTLGYGDVVLGPEARILATFCAITGLLTFGISTAFLIGVLSRLLPQAFGD